MFVNEETSKPITVKDLTDAIAKLLEARVEKNDFHFFYTTNMIKRGIEIDLFYEKDGIVHYRGYPVVDTITQKLAKFEDYRR